MRNKQSDSLSRESGSSGGHAPVERPAERAALTDLLERARFEVLPTPSIEELVRTHLPVERMLTVTASTARGLEATLGTAESLAARGHPVVPHIAARMVVDRAHLAEIVDRLRGAGIDRVFVPGGDGEPVGAYPDAPSLLADLAALGAGAGLGATGSPFAHVGITAYPESHPSISDDQMIQAMWDKRHHATEMVSNITFDPDTLATWLTRVRGRGVTLPLWVGVPGPADPTKLLTVATRIGVGESTRYLLKNRRTVARLMRPGGSRSDDFLRRLEPVLARPESRVAGLHVFTFNQVAESEAWRARLLADLHKRSRNPVHRTVARIR